MPDLEVLTTADRRRWLAALGEVGRYDSYHLPQYHELAERNGDGDARLLVYRDGPTTVALPLMLRPCATIDGLDGEPWLDAGSVYGYGGPLASSLVLPQSVLTGFHAALRDVFKGWQVATLYSNLDPVLEQAPLAAGLGDVMANGTTVSIDLSLPPAEQVARYRRDHLHGVRRLRSRGFECAIEDPPDLDAFVEIYHETMTRVGAAPEYFFDLAYFRAMQELMGSQLKLFRCTHDGDLAAAAVFLVCGDIVQYHLAATRTAYLSMAPAKLVVDTARTWATEAGLRVLHLGGGLGAREDSLFQFKAGFSDQRHSFTTWRWVTDPDAYAGLSARKSAWNAERGFESTSPDHFPTYRSRIAPANAPELPERPRRAGSAGPGRNILITAAGRRTSLTRAFAAEAKRRGGRVIAGDIDPLAPALSMVDAALRLPATSDAGYLPNLLQIVDECQIGLLVPTIDPDLPILAQARDTLRSVGCIAVVSNPAFVDLVADKLATAVAFGQHGVAVPGTWLPENIPDELQTVFVKPRLGSGSIGARIATRQNLSLALADAEDPIVQEVLTGAEVTIDALLDFAGRPIHYVPRVRLRTLAGESIEGVTLQHERSIERWIEDLLALCGALGAAGPLCLQAFLTSDGPVLVEINARFGGGFPLAQEAGGSYAAWLLDLADGVPVPSRLGQYEAGLYMTRYYVEQFTRSPRW